MQSRLSGKRKGFTLIELLIVIAIILILIAIALPNFMTAKIRATITQVRAELRSVSIAVESYATDNNALYPINKLTSLGGGVDRGRLNQITGLTTPIKYLEPVVLNTLDPFFGETNFKSYGFLNRDVYAERHPSQNIPKRRVHYILLSLGPDKVRGPHPETGNAWSMNSYQRAQYDPRMAPHFDPTFVAWRYSATNGTRSNGDIMRIP